MKSLIYLIILIGCIFYGYKIAKKKIYLWLPSYLLWAFNKSWFKEDINGPVHIMFLVADHYEPGPNNEIVKQWVEKYPEIAKKHRDADGRPPRHTWFYPSERAEERFEQLQMLKKLTESGFGEIELHLHHQNDTEESLRQKFRDAKRVYNKVGALITVDEKITFGFVHGDWALDNSIKINNENLCGVNNEITILKEEGCYADFTFPALNTDAQPKKINSIYYAVDDPHTPKSYDTGIEVEADRPPKGDLMIVQGPLSINLRDWISVFYPRIENGEVEGSNPVYVSRVDQWVKTGIHVKGKPDWIFIKIHTHGAISDSMNIFLGNAIDKIYSYLEAKYNDGVNYRLHYVTAREAYNIIKAAEAGLLGNPNHYRDYIIKPYKNTVQQSKRTND